MKYTQLIPHLHQTITRKESGQLRKMTFLPSMSLSTMRRTGTKSALTSQEEIPFNASTDGPKSSNQDL